MQNENRGKEAENNIFHLKTQFKTTNGFLHFSLIILMNLLLTRDMKSYSSKKTLKVSSTFWGESELKSPVKENSVFFL